MAQLPKLEFRTNLPERFKLVYGDAKEIPSKTEGWASSYMYRVEHGGETKVLFATDGLHSRLVDLGVGKGGEISVTKAETKLPSGKMGTDWQVEVHAAGTPVAPRAAQSPATAPQASQAPQAQAAPAKGAGERLAILGAAYAACLDEARGVWQREGVEATDNETLHSTAASLFIQLTREGYDLAAFVDSYGEKEGTKALRRMIEKVKTVPYLSDVAEHFGTRLDTFPRDDNERRRLYVELREAVKTATDIAEEATAEQGPDLGDEPVEPPFDEVEPEPAAEPEQGPVTAESFESEEHLALAREIRALADDLWSGKNNELQALMDKVARTSNVRVTALNVGQLKTIRRTLQSMAPKAA